MQLKHCQNYRNNLQQIAIKRPTHGKFRNCKTCPKKPHLFEVGE